MGISYGGGSGPPFPGSHGQGTFTVVVMFPGRRQMPLMGTVSNVMATGLEGKQQGVVNQLEPLEDSEP